MTTKVVNLRDFSKELKRFSEDNIEEAKKAIFIGCVKSIPMLVEKSPVDTGLYAASWDAHEAKESVFIGNTAPHAPIIEYGARPFTPPLAPLLAWAKRVLKDPSQPPNYSSEVWALAKGTQKKIQLEGMKPKSVLRNNMDEILKNIEQELTKIG